MTGPTAPMTRREVSNRLMSELLDTGLKPGTKLPSERQLAERFGLSRPIVREVLSELRERGLIDIQPGRGAFVAAVTSTDASRLVESLYRRGQATPRHLIEARVMLETRAASLAARRATPEDVAAMERALRGFGDAISVLDRAQADIAFHGIIARASHNPVIDIMFGSISGLTFELMLRSLDDPVVVDQGAPYHDTIYEAIRAGDSELAARAMTDHLEVAHGTYGDDLDLTLDSIARRKIDELVGRGVPIDAVVGEAIRSFRDGDSPPRRLLDR